MRSKLLLCCACAVGVCLAGAEDLKIEATSAFVGYGQASGTIPLAVTLKNKGGDARGSLHVKAGDFEMDYPVELPRGASKRVIAYPRLSYGEEVSLDLITNQGNVHGNYRQLLVTDPSSQAVLLVGDNQGELGFMTPQAGSVARMTPAYVSPELVPDRALAFSGVCAVVLGSGSERMSDGAVHALHTYIAGGGAVIFLGGASSPSLDDKRWADVAPVASKGPKTLQKSQLIDYWKPLNAPFTVLNCTAVGNAIVRKENDTVILAKRSVGLGRTLFMAFNPLEPPFSTWPKKRELFDKVLRPVDTTRSTGYLDQFTVDNSDPYQTYYAARAYPATAGTTGGYPYTEEPTRADPFSTKLPAPEKVLTILAWYFVVIIPINFILLKKLKKGEWAWFTAPLISVAFAGIFFASARDLYAAKLSTATQGLIVANANGTDSIFVGRSQLFFPQGGEYDLKMEGLESIGAVTRNDEYEYYGSGRSQEPGSTDLNPIDVGTVQVKRMDVSNLAFRELSFRQVLPTSSWVECSVVKVGGGSVLKVRNASPYKLKDMTAIVAGQSFGPTTLDPGQEHKFALPSVINAYIPPPEPGYSPSYRRGYGSYDSIAYTGLDQITSSSKEIVIKASVPGYPAGPQIGETVAARQSVTLAFFTGIRYGEAAL